MGTQYSVMHSDAIYKPNLYHILTFLKDVVPATIAVIKGRIHVGLEDGMLEELAGAKNTIKISRRDFPYALAKNLSGGTTVAGTMMIAHQVCDVLYLFMIF